MRKVNFQGLPLVIEVEPGEVRTFDDGSTSMPYKYSYGYIEDTISNEPGEEQDVLLGDDENAENAYLYPIFDKKDRSQLDEFKLLLGFSTAEEAQEAGDYTWQWSCYGNSPGSTTVILMTMEDLIDQIELQLPMARKDQEGTDSDPRLPEKGEEDQEEDAEEMGGDEYENDEPIIVMGTN